MSALAERVAGLVGKAKEREAVVTPADPLTWWTVHKPGGEVVEVLVLPPQTQREMMALYPQAGCIPAAHRGL